MKQIQVAEAIAYLRALDYQHIHEQGRTHWFEIAELMQALANHARETELKDAPIWDGFDGEESP